ELNSRPVFFFSLSNCDQSPRAINTSPSSRTCERGDHDLCLSRNSSNTYTPYCSPNLASSTEVPMSEESDMTRNSVMYLPNSYCSTSSLARVSGKSQRPSVNK